MSNIIDEVVRLSKLGPLPPPVVTPEAIVFRRAAPYELEDYRGGYGPILVESTPSTENEDEVISELPARVELSATHNFGEDDGTPSPQILWAIWATVLAYLMTQNLSLQYASAYLEVISRAGLSFPPEIQTAFTETLGELPKSERLERQLIVFGEVANHLQLFIPKHLLMTRGLPYYFYTSLYWLRVSPNISVRSRGVLPESRGVLPESRGVLPESLRDLYLITANPFDRYPARKYLSYLRDPELYLRFGRSDNYFFPKIYSTRRQQLDGFVAFSLAQYGYYTVKSWSRPIRIVLTQPRKTISLKSEINQTDISLNEIMRRPDIRALRLSIQVESSWPWLKDQEAWIPFLNWIKTQNGNFSEELQSLIHSDRIDDQFGSLEDNFNLCLICQVIRPDEEFSLCGHPICSVCQPLLKSPKCPFCTEHFVCDSLDDRFIQRMLSPPESALDLTSRIGYILEEKEKRKYSFDWSSY